MYTKVVHLPILHHTDQTATFKDLGISYELDQCEERVVSFFVINAISPYHYKGRIWTEIHSNGTEYICPKDAHDVLNLILD